MVAKKLNVLNAQQLIYENDILSLTVLGGIKLEGLDRMRATLKIQLNKSSTPPVRHNLDLYNDLQVEKLTRKTAERLEVGTSVVAASISELTEQLETYRLEEISKQDIQEVENSKLSPSEHKQAEDFLSSEGLLERTNGMIGQSGMIGEEVNRLLMYLVFTSRKQPQPLHVVSLGASGVGKTHLQEKIAELIPPEERVEVTTLSENAFYYFGRQELKNKLILIEDLDGLSGTGANGAYYALRELQSKKRISKTIAHKNTKGETRSIRLVVEGPVAVAGCTTHEQIYEDNANRSFLLYLDDSLEQDERIMDYQRAVSAGKVDVEKQQEAVRLLRNTQRLLSPIRVINPYAEQLKIPKEVFKPRRTNRHYLEFIEAVTFYHQYQRVKHVDKQTGEEYIQTTLEDIRHANRLLKQTLLRKSDELSGACRNYFESVKAYLASRGQKQLDTNSLSNKGYESDTDFTNQEIRKALRINPSNQKRYTLALVSNHYIRKVKGKPGTAYYYQVVSNTEYQELKTQIENVLDNNLKQLEGQSDANKKCQSDTDQDSDTDRFTGSVAVQTANEPVNKKKTKALS